MFQVQGLEIPEQSEMLYDGVFSPFLFPGGIRRDVKYAYGGRARTLTAEGLKLERSLNDGY